MCRRISFLMCVWLCVSTASASVRHYQHDFDTANWQVTHSSKLLCELTQELPGYGSASFHSEAARQLNLEFTIDFLRQPNRYDSATVYSVPPNYLPGITQKVLGEMSIRRQYPSTLPSNVAWEMLTELEKGFSPTIFYQDWNSRFDRVAVALSPIRFADEYQNFAACIAKLLPFGFQDIAYTILRYQPGSTELTMYSRKRLSMISQYLSEDKDMEIVLVDAYTDASGGRFQNDELSVQRAQTVKQFFVDQGIDENRVQITGHGERRHIASNQFDRGKAANRRVVIQMTRQRELEL